MIITSSRRIVAATACVIAAVAGAPWGGASSPLPIDRERVECRNAELRWDGEIARILLHPSTEGPTRVALRSPGGDWDLSNHGLLTVELAGADAAAEPIELFVQLETMENDGMPRFTGRRLVLEPGSAASAAIPLVPDGLASLRRQLFGMKLLPPRFTPAKDALDLSQVQRLAIVATKLNSEAQILLRSAALTGQPASPTTGPAELGAFFPFVDRFGQYIHEDWPGKLSDESELHARREAEERKLADDRGPIAWNRYGGWEVGPKREATGFFRTERVDGGWWMIDPDGRLFFSVGVDSVNYYNGATPIDDRDHWFAGFPGDQPQFRDLITTAPIPAVRGYYAGRTPRCFNFTVANLLRKYGDDWMAAMADSDHRRMRAFGLNTVGNWGMSEVYLLRRTPYTVGINVSTRKIEGSSGWWRKFSDPFDRSFREALEEGMSGVRDTWDDPWCIGYFVDNELSWGEGDALARWTLQSPADQPAKLQLVQDLKRKYADQIGQLNAAWATEHASWDDLLSSTEIPNSDAAVEDLAAFSERVRDAYFGTCRDVIRRHAPNHLYLGCRFMSETLKTPEVLRSAAKHCDVISMNLYRPDVAALAPPEGVDKPLLIGEFHFGAPDRGLFGCGLQKVANQHERAASYRRYVTSALTNRWLVGTHWFQWRDQPLTGRFFDGENHQVGFIDVTDTPYPELTAASRELAERMYDLRAAAFTSGNQTGALAP